MSKGLNKAAVGGKLIYYDGYMQALTDINDCLADKDPSAKLAALSKRVHVEMNTLANDMSNT